MKKLFIAIMTMVASCVMAQVADPVIMTINGKDVPRSEFEYSYNKNNGADVIDHKTVEEYVDLFVKFKLKVEAALDTKLDTMVSYNKEFRQYRDQQVLPTLISDDDLEKGARDIYDRTKENVGKDGYRDVSHILLLVRQDADESVKKAQGERADSIYNALMKGADFGEMARKFSQDPGSARNNGNLGGWVGRKQTVQEFDDAMFATKVGEISKPVLSQFGYHILKVNAQKEMEPYDSLRADILRFMEQRGIRESIMKDRLKTIAESKGISEEEVMDQRADSISAIDQNMKYLIKEYHDGLLLYEICNREVWDKAAKDEKGLEAFYKKNKKKYVWDAPRFKGIAYYTREASDIEAVKKSVKGKKFGDWAQILRTTFNKDSVLRIRVEKGVFKKGDNKMVDKEQFGDAEAKVREVKDFPYTATFGKMLKAPEEMSDVKALVITDYQEEMEKAWIAGLEKKYPVVIDKAVLATVKPQ